MCAGEHDCIEQWSFPPQGQSERHQDSDHRLLLLLSLLDVQRGTLVSVATRRQRRLHQLVLSPVGWHIVTCRPTYLHCYLPYYHLSVVVVLIASCINPFIYAVNYKQFQDGFKRLTETLASKMRLTVTEVTNSSGTGLAASVVPPSGWHKTARQLSRHTSDA